MISFKTFIVESVEAENAFKSAKSVAPYIESKRYKEMYLESLDALANAAKNKEIYNARFGEYKNRMMRGIEYAYKTLFNEIKDDIIKSGQDTFDLWSITSITDINKVTKIYDKMKPQNKKASDFVNAVRGIPNALKVMKGYVKSGKPPAEPKPGQFIKPLASMAASKLAIKFMTEATASFKANLNKDINDRTLATYAKIKDIKVPNEIPNADEAKILATIIFIVRGAGANKTLELKEDADKRVKKYIDETVNDIITGFISKNSGKLALILQKKNEPKSHKIVKTNIRNGMVENVMDFEFTDGSSFVLESTVIYKYSKTGKLFFQYPTRFKNVKLADGSKMKMPSEEKMIKEF